MRSAALLLMVLPFLSAAAQEPLETKLVVTQNGQEIGREEFTLRSTRGRGLPGIDHHRRRPLSVHQSHDPAGRHARAHPGFGARQVPARCRERRGGDRHSGRGVGRPADRADRGQGLRIGRELPGGPDVVLLDDAVFSLYHPVAELATPAGRTLTAIFPARASGPRSRPGASRGRRRRRSGGPERRDHRHAGHRRAGPARAGRAAREGHGRHASRVGPPASRYPQR